jgi:uncharacterized protein
MLRVRQRSDQARLLDDRDRAAALEVCAVDPVANVFVESRIRAFGLDPGRLGAQMWGYEQGGRLVSVCYGGANLVPVQATSSAIAAFADRALRQGRRCSSIVGTSAAVSELWGYLRPYWGPARDVRAAQPLMAIDGPSPIPADPAVRRVRLEELDILLPASIAMFTEEVGISPLAGDGGASYRARVSELVRSGRAFARIEDGQVIFKAEVGAATPQACQVQGVWVRPEYRGQGVAAPGMAAVVALARQSISPVVSLYVNDFNAPARATYKRAGFAEVGEFMSVLFLSSPGPFRFLVAVADEAKLLKDGQVRLGQRGEFRRLELIDEVLADAGDVERRYLLDHGRAVGGQDRERAALVALAALPGDQAPGLHPVDLVREPAAGLRGPVGELGHPHPAVWRLRQLDQDLVVVHGQSERVQVPVELAHQQLR